MLCLCCLTFYFPIFFNFFFKFKSLIIFQIFFFCHPLYIQMGDQTVVLELVFIPVLHSLRWFLVLRSEWLSPESSTNIQGLLPCSHKPSQLTIPRCCCLHWALSPGQICISPASSSLVQGLRCCLCLGSCTFN